MLHHLSGTPVWWKCSMNGHNVKVLIIEKTDTKVSFTITLVVHWISFLSSIAQDGKDGNGSKLEEICQRFQVWMQYMNFKIKPNFNFDNFLWQNNNYYYLIFCFWLITNIVVNQIQYQLQFFNQSWPKNSKTTVTVPL